MSSTSYESPNIEAAAAPKKLPSLWRNRNYLLLWSGQAVSNIGSTVSAFAFPLLILFLTQSPAQAGFSSALRSIPYLFLSLPAGALVDRWDRKRVMILCDTGRALALGSIPVAVALGHLTILQIYLAALIEGTLFVFFNLAETASLPRVVAQEQLPAATGQNQAAEGTAILIGPPLGGILYSAARLLPFLADAISYAISVGSLFLIRARFQEERVEERRPLRAKIAEGVVWLWRQPLIRFLALLNGTGNVLFAGLPLILIVIAQRQGAAPPVIGLIFTIAAIGGILGSILAPIMQKRLSFGAVTIGVHWLNALLLPLYAIAPNPFLLGAITGAILFINPLYDVTQFSYRLALIPDALQGRVNSVFRLFALGFQPLGFALTGILLQWLGPAVTILLLTSGIIIQAAAASVYPQVRHARPIADTTSG